MSKQNSPITKNGSKRASEKLTSLKLCPAKLEACLKLKRVKNFRQFCEVLKESVYNNNFNQEIKFMQENVSRVRAKRSVIPWICNFRINNWSK